MCLAYADQNAAHSTITAGRTKILKLQSIACIRAKIAKTYMRIRTIQIITCGDYYGNAFLPFADGHVRLTTTCGMELLIPVLRAEHSASALLSSRQGNTGSNMSGNMRRRGTRKQTQGLGSGPGRKQVPREGKQCIEALRALGRALICRWPTCLT